MRVLLQALTAGLRADPRDPAALLVPVKESSRALDEAGGWAGIAGLPLEALSHLSAARPGTYVEKGQRSRRAAEADFAAAAAHGQLCSVLVDATRGQSATVSEHLTLVATVFLSLNVAVGFFGMSFGWMTIHLGSPASFFLVGIGMQALLVVAGLRLARNVDVDPTGSRRSEDGKGSPSQ